MLTRICSRASRQIYLLAAAIVLFVALPAADAQGFVWARKVSTNVDEEAFGVATGPGGVYVVGYTNGSLGGQANAGNRDAVVVKFSPAGDQLWIRQFGTASADTLRAVTTDASGVYVAGTTSGALSGSSAGASDAFVRKYDPNGNELWTRQFGTPSDDEALGIASDGTGVYVVGKTQGTFAGQPTSANGDPFVRKYDANGNELWTRQFGTRPARRTPLAWLRTPPAFTSRAGPTGLWRRPARGASMPSCASTMPAGPWSGRASSEPPRRRLPTRWQ